MIDFVIETIKDGYKIPLKETPIKTELRNNMSAIQNSDFVNEALKELIVSNCVIEVQNKPHVINPLSVSTNSSGKETDFGSSLREQTSLETVSKI